VPFLILAFVLPGVVVGAGWALPALRRGWKARPVRLKLSAILLSAASYVLCAAAIHAIAALQTTCALPDCAMGYVLGVGLLLPVGLFLLSSGLLLRARPLVVVAGHLLLALPIIDFVLWASREDYDSVITWAGQ
jgi:hypothetical protein